MPYKMHLFLIFSLSCQWIQKKVQVPQQNLTELHVYRLRHKTEQSFYSHKHLILTNGGMTTSGYCKSRWRMSHRTSWRLTQRFSHLWSTGLNHWANKFQPILTFRYIKKKTLPGAAVYNFKLDKEHLTNPGNYHEPRKTSPASQSAKTSTREGQKVVTPSDYVQSLLYPILKIKITDIFNTLGIQACCCSFLCVSSWLAATTLSSHSIGAKFTCSHRVNFNPQLNISGG